MLVGRSKKVRRWSVSAEWSSAGFVDFVSFSLQSVSLRRRGGMADTSDLKSEGVKTPCGFESRRRHIFPARKNPRSWPRVFVK